MTGLLKRLEPRGASDEIANRSAIERLAFRKRVASETFRGIVSVLAVVFMIVAVLLMCYQLYQISNAIDKIDQNYKATLVGTTNVSNISVLAAFCANLPESTTVAKIQQCIETNIKEVK
jgi:hypothetical protein